MGHYIAGSRIRPNMGRVLIVVVILSSLFAFTTLYRLNTFVASAITPPDSCFNFDSGTITGYYYNENNDSEQAACPKNVDIPSTIGGVPVTTIGTAAFGGKSLTSVSFPSSVVSIQNEAFGGNSLATITFSEGLQSIGYQAFMFNQITSLVLPDSLTTVGEGAFFYSSNLVNLHIGSGLAGLPNGVFQGSGLKELYIPSTVTSFTQSTFQSSYIEKLTIGEANYNGPAILDIPYAAFQGQEISELKLYQNVRLIDEFAFAYNNLDGILSYPDILPEALESIGYAAFQGNEITAVILPNVHTMGDYPFNLNPITSVTIGTSDYTGPALLDVPPMTAPFYGPIASLSLGPIVRSIKDDAFNSHRLTSLDLPNSVQTIGDDAFANNRLTSINIPDSVTSIGSDAFSSNFDSSDPHSITVTIGSGIQTIGDGAFSSNPTLDEVYISGNPVMSDSTFDYSGGICGGTELSKCYIRIYAPHPEFVETYGPGRLVTTLDWNDNLAMRLGYIINPATYQVGYESSTGETLAPSVMSGISPTLADYTFAANQSGDFSLYYLGGDEIPLSPPDFDGYVTPSAYNLTLAGGSNIYTFVYASVNSGSAEPSSEDALGENLANTGINWLGIMALGGLTIFGAILTIKTTRKQL